MLNRKPTQRHKEIAEIATHLSLNKKAFTAEDVKLIFKANEIEYSERTGKEPYGPGWRKENLFSREDR